MPTKFLPILLLGTTLLSGCAWFDGSDIPASGTRLQKREAVALAKAKAETEGHDLKEYRVDQVQLDKTKKTYVWRISFQQKQQPNKHLNATVWDLTGDAAIQALSQ